MAFYTIPNLLKTVVALKLRLTHHYFYLNTKVTKSVVKPAYSTELQKNLQCESFLVLFLGTELTHFEMGLHHDYCVYYWENFNTYFIEVSRTQTIMIAYAQQNYVIKQTT